MIVRILEQQNKAALVEWQDVMGLHRAILPADKVAASGEAAAKDLERGIAYGVPWETLAVVTVTSHTIARLMRSKGIWTEDDLQKNLPQVRAAFTEAWNIDLKNLIDSVRQARDGGNP